MCAVDSDGSSAAEEAAPLLVLSDQSVGSSSLSSIAEDEELVSDPERYSSPSSGGSSKVKMMCSYGGRILPRPQDGQLRYFGGETRILVVKKGVSFADLSGKLARLARRGVVLKYQLPHEDLDALVSVTSDEDLRNMVDEYEKMESRATGEGAARLRVFLFPAPSRNPFVAPDSDGESRSPRRVKAKSLEPPPARKSHNPGQLPGQQQQQLQNDSFGSLRVYQLNNHAPSLEQQDIHECSRGGFSDHHAGLHQKHHHHLESCGCRAPAPSWKVYCEQCATSGSMLPPRPQRLNSYQLHHPLQEFTQLHHPQYHHQYPAPHYQQQQIHHPVRPGVHEQQQQKIYRPDIRPEIGVSNSKFCFDHFYYNKPPSQQQQVYEALHW